MVTATTPVAMTSFQHAFSECLFFWCEAIDEKHGDIIKDGHLGFPDRGEADMLLSQDM